MRAHWFGASGSMLALLVGLTSVHAQDGRGEGPGTSTPTSGTLSPGGSPRAGETVGSTEAEIGGVRARAAVSPDEQLREADRITRRAGQLAERLSKMLDEARRDRDILRANCVNRKLTEVNANTRNVEQRSRSLRDAAAAGDDARRGHEFTVLTVLAQKLESIDREATQCLGQAVYEPGASQIVTTILQGSPTLDPSVIDPSTAAPPSVTVPPPNIVVPEEMSPAQ